VIHALHVINYMHAELFFFFAFLEMHRGSASIVGIGLESLPFLASSFLPTIDGEGGINYWTRPLKTGAK